MRNSRENFLGAGLTELGLLILKNYF